MMHEEHREQTITRFTRNLLLIRKAYCDGLSVSTNSGLGILVLEWLEAK